MITKIYLSYRLFLMFSAVLIFCNFSAYSQTTYVLYCIVGANPSTLNRINSDGTGLATIYTAPNNTTQVYGVTVDASLNKVYFYVDTPPAYNTGKIYQCNLNGTNLVVFLDVSSSSGISGMAAGGGFLYYTPFSTKTLEKIKSDGTTHSLLYTGTYYISDVALDLPNSYLFFVEFGDQYNLYRSNLSGGSKTTLFSGGTSNLLGAVAAGNGYVFYKTGGNPNHNLFRRNNDGTGLATAFTVSVSSISNSAYDNTNHNLYFVNSTNIYKAGANGTGGVIIKTLSSELGGFGFNLGVAPNAASLPVELFSFSAILNSNSVNLKWETSTEVNNYGFDVERSVLSEQPSEWEKIGFIKGQGNSSSQKDYSFVDKTLVNGTVQYRLKQIDSDGKFEYSSVVELHVNVPFKFELSQNYPNPFNPSTTINFALPEAGKYTLKIYNILGQEVAQLASGQMEIGNYSLPFDASKLVSGIYVYCLQGNKVNFSKKMILLR